jgi:Protein of unknown function (DUF2510)
MYAIPSSVTAAVPSNQSLMTAEIIVVAVIVFILMVLLVRRAIQKRDVRIRRAASGSYYDADVAHYGTGPSGFSGAAAARTIDSTPLAPSFDAGGGGPGSPAARTGPSFGSAGPGGSAPAPAFGVPASGEHGSITPPAVPTSPPAGWLPDPTGNPQLLRYWDGVQWTDHTAHR